jgi:hypothetical protein
MKNFFEKFTRKGSTQQLDLSHSVPSRSSLNSSQQQPHVAKEEKCMTSNEMMKLGALVEVISQQGLTETEKNDRLFIATLRFNKLVEEEKILLDRDTLTSSSSLAALEHIFVPLCSYCSNYIACQFAPLVDDKADNTSDFVEKFSDCANIEREETANTDTYRDSSLNFLPEDNSDDPLLASCFNVLIICCAGIVEDVADCVVAVHLPSLVANALLKLAYTPKRVIRENATRARTSISFVSSSVGREDVLRITASFYKLLFLMSASDKCVNDLSYESSPSSNSFRAFFTLLTTPATTNDDEIIFKEVKANIKAMVIEMANHHLHRHTFQTALSHSCAMQTLIGIMRDTQNRDSKDILDALELVAVFLRLSAGGKNSQSSVVIRDFSACRGYQSFHEAVCWLEKMWLSEDQDANNNTAGSSSGDNLPQQQQLGQTIIIAIDISFELVFVGPAITLSGPVAKTIDVEKNAELFHNYQEISKDISLVHANNIIRNPEAFSILLQFFHSAQSDTTRAKVMESFIKLFSYHPANFIVLQDTGGVLRPFLVAPDSLSQHVRDDLTRLVSFMMTSLPCIPLKDLTVFTTLLKKNEQTQRFALAVINKLVNYDPDYCVALREAGVLSAVALKLATLTRTPTVSSTVIILLDILLLLIEHSHGNRSEVSSQPSNVRTLIIFVENEASRKKALSVLTLLLLGERLEQEQRKAILSGLVELVQNSGVTVADPFLSSAVMEVVSVVLAESLELRKVFAECDGFSLVSASLNQLAAAFSEDAPEALKEGRVCALESAFSVCSAAQAYPQNRNAFRERVGFVIVVDCIRSSSILNSPREGLRALRALLGLCFENSPKVDTKSSWGENVSSRPAPPMLSHFKPSSMDLSERGVQRNTPVS